MKEMLKSLVFFGSGPVAAAGLEFLHDNFNIEFVVTKSRPPHHKDLTLIEDYCTHNNINIVFANNELELETSLSNIQFESVLGVVIDFGIIIPKSVIDLFSKGILNSHFSLLPEWRGADPITYSLLSGQKQTGVSLMLIDSGLDTGFLIAQEKIIIKSSDDNGSLTSKLVELSNQMLVDNIERYLDEKITPYPQKLWPVTFSRKITKDDKNIDTARPASVIEREIKAYITWPRSSIHLNNQEVLITKATASERHIKPQEIFVEKKHIFLGCKIGSLELIELQPTGKKPMNAGSFINGYSGLLL